MKIFMTGATGFIGSATARCLTSLDHSLTCLVRGRGRDGNLAALGCELVEGDVTGPPEDLARMMDGHDAVIHNAGIYEVGIPASRIGELEAVNVTGTGNVLEGALRAGIPRALYVSTCAVFGNTRGGVATEAFRRPDLDRSGGLEFGSTYERTKFEAHQVALRLIEERNLPCVIVQPSGVYGPGDHSSLGASIHSFLDGRMPLIPFPEFGTALAHVDDVAAGLALALDRGEPGRSYILTADNHTMREIIGLTARLVGRKAPGRAMPTTLLKALRPIGPLVGKLMGLPPNLAELIRSTDGVTYYADGSRARDELGFEPRDLATGLRETLAAEGRLREVD